MPETTNFIVASGAHTHTHSGVGFVVSLLLSLLFFGCCLVVVWLLFGCSCCWLLVVVVGVVVVSRSSKDSASQMGSICPLRERDLQTPKAAKVCPRKIDSMFLSCLPPAAANR